MRIGQRLLLISRNVRHRPGRAVFACLGVGVGMAIFLVALSVGWGVQFRILKRLRESMPERILTARRGHVDLGPLRLDTGLITPADVDRIRALPDVESVWPQVPIRFPLHAEGDLMGVELSTDLVIYGIDPALARGDVAEGKSFAYDPRPGATAPVIVSRFLLDLYNLGYAEANHLPKLSDHAAIGRHFDLVLGQSTVREMGDMANARRLPCEVVGLTGNPSLFGVAMPADWVMALNREFAPQAAPQFNAVHIRLKDVEGLERVEQALTQMNLQPDSQRELVRRLQFFLRILLAVLLVFGALVLIVAFSNVVNTFSLVLLERRFEIGLLRAVGATRGSVMALFLAEAGLLGAAGGAFGALAAFAMASGANWLSRSFLPPLSILPPNQRMLVFNWALAVFGVALAAVASMLVTLPIVWRETARQPAVLLRQD
ncbi:MAG: ABC transporter permease [Candidatus Sumerlaeota bacterium]|nr:ABC transporter permease [Candidatus Sumerlaeota bacterium]